MHRNWVLAAGMALALVTAAGCGGSRRGAEQAGMIAEDSRRLTRIPKDSTPAMAEAAMGRKPDAVNRDGDFEVHYYIVRGAVNGETLRLVFREGKLISQNLEYAQIQK